MKIDENLLVILWLTERIVSITNKKALTRQLKQISTAAMAYSLRENDAHRRFVFNLQSKGQK
jgi:hypothetical protein